MTPLPAPVADADAAARMSESVAARLSGVGFDRKRLHEHIDIVVDSYERSLPRCGACGVGCHYDLDHIYWFAKRDAEIAGRPLAAGWLRLDPMADSPSVVVRHLCPACAARIIPAVPSGPSAPPSSEGVRGTPVPRVLNAL